MSSLVDILQANHTPNLTTKKQTAQAHAHGHCIQIVSLVAQGMTVCNQAIFSIVMSKRVAVLSLAITVRVNSP